MRITVIPVVIGTLGTIPKGLEKGLEALEIVGRIETIRTTALLKSARILRVNPGAMRRLVATQTPVKGHQ